ncbi:SPOR domain-containing protein [Thioalkalivibrio sulfidiphilus]|uniref:Sporulation domain-containing protein n=1 Tax=Thioalkalivibrio sulfidiphilus (strain HL-EbGR7) TaxID=396588 RepID=B8GLC4_THISH|nr:SPOR domain-containing protein [Thioalkalivibrio sulfidiphilus]ACL73479.1 sporulation domain-containing protein [Thioalkalivibrio sulfidiphilus HL-EbGr7]
MRTLVLILVLLNGAYLYWQTQVKPPREAGTPVESLETRNATRLVLLSERIAGPAPEAPASPETLGTAPRWHCETVGPFVSRMEAQTLSAQLEAQGLMGDLRSVSREIVSSYWVFLPPRATREAALNLARDLAGRGLLDLYVIGEGEHRNGISLGLFSEHERARRRVEQVEAMGYGPRIEARTRTQTLYWLDLAGPEESYADVTLPDGVNRMERACPPLVVP